VSRIGKAVILIIATLTCEIDEYISYSLEKRCTYLMEPAGTQDVAGREHDHECDQIEGRLVGEESVRLDSESEPVNQCLSWGL
jgi:hypothetical protein